jgi:hypothetical protein
MTNRSKGLDLEKKLRRHLEAKGFLVHQARAASKQIGGRWYTNQNDVFGVFDLVAARAHPLEDCDDEVLWIQVTTETGASSRRGKIAAFGDQVTKDHPILRGTLLAIHYDRKGWRFQRPIGGSEQGTAMPQSFEGVTPWWAEGLRLKNGTKP